MPNLLAALPLAAKALCLSKWKCPEAGRVRNVWAVASACLPLSSESPSPSPSPSEACAPSDNCALEERREEAEEVVADRHSELEFVARASSPSFPPLESGGPRCGWAGSSRGDPPWGGESLEGGAEALESSSAAPEWGALRAGEAGFAPGYTELRSRRTLEGGRRLGNRAGRGWREPAASSSSSESTESLSLKRAGREGRWEVPWVAARWAGEAEAAGAVPGRGWVAGEKPGLSTPAVRGSAGIRALTAVLPGATPEWPCLLGGLGGRFWSCVSEGDVGESAREPSSSFPREAGVFGAPHRWPGFCSSSQGEGPWHFSLEKQELWEKARKARLVRVSHCPPCSAEHPPYRLQEILKNCLSKKNSKAKAEASPVCGPDFEKIALSRLQAIHQGRSRVSRIDILDGSKDSFWMNIKENHGLGAVAHTCNPNTLGGRGRWTTRSRDGDHPGQHGETPFLLKEIQKLAGHGGAHLTGSTQDTSTDWDDMTRTLMSDHVSKRRGFCHQQGKHHDMCPLLDLKCVMDAATDMAQTRSQLLQLRGDLQKEVSCSLSAPILLSPLPLTVPWPLQVQVFA
ncbi:Zinc finger protein 714 [Plecturocebus cupreus]